MGDVLMLATSRHLEQEGLTVHGLPSTSKSLRLRTCARTSRAAVQEAQVATSTSSKAVIPSTARHPSRADAVMC